MKTHWTTEKLSKIRLLVLLLVFAYLSSYAYVRHSHGIYRSWPDPGTTVFNYDKTSDRLLATLYLPLLKLDEKITGRRVMGVIS